MQPFNLMLIGAASGHKSPRVLAVLIGNLIPAVCVLLFGWSVFPLMVLYWMENLIVGGFNIAKIVISGVSRGFPGTVAVVFYAPFFTFHYGMFCFIHGLFVWTIFSSGAGPQPEGMDPFSLLSAAKTMVFADRDLALNLAALFGVHLFQFVGDWLGKARWKEDGPETQMTKPYGRIVVLHLTILGGAVPVLMLGQPVFAVFLLAVLKTVIEVAGAARKPTPAAVRSTSG